MEKIGRIRARAPCKIIFTGEHSVIEGFSAIAVTLNFYLEATLTESRDFTYFEVMRDYNTGQGNMRLKWDVKDLSSERYKTAECSLSKLSCYEEPIQFDEVIREMEGIIDSADIECVDNAYKNNFKKAALIFLIILFGLQLHRY